MGVTYFKRYRMEISLGAKAAPEPPLPAGYRLVGWRPSLVYVHADTKYRSFCAEIDSNVFPCLGDATGCQRLMEEISDKKGFLPQATWLLVYQPYVDAEPDFCGTIQGIADIHRVGGVQNLGITPEHRGQGLGTNLLLKALNGFRHVGLRRACLEVTAQNASAVRLYRRLGFRRTKTLYKAVEVAYS